MRGEGVAKDEGKAFDLLEDAVASDGNHKRALNDLACLHLKGVLRAVVEA